MYCLGTNNDEKEYTLVCSKDLILVAVVVRVQHLQKEKILSFFIGIKG